MFLVVTLIFVLAPKSSSGVTATPTEIVDTTYPLHVGMMFIACFMLFVGLLALLVFVGYNTVRAQKVINDQSNPTISY